MSTLTEWESTLSDINVRAMIVHRASWALKIPEERRMKSLHTLLLKADAMARAVRIERDDRRVKVAANSYAKDHDGNYLDPRRTSRFQILP